MFDGKSFSETFFLSKSSRSQKSMSKSPTVLTNQTHFQMEVDMEQVGRVLSSDTLTYLTFEGVRLYEDHELCMRDRNSDPSSGVRGLHLLVTAISEFIFALQTFSKFRHLPDQVLSPSHFLFPILPFVQKFALKANQ